MRAALAMLTRPMLALAVVATASAVGLSRLAPPTGTRRTPRAVGHVLITAPGLGPAYPSTLWLDRDAGGTTLLAPPGGKILQHGSLSPWLDESGRPQVVGLLSARPGDGSTEGFGLVRATFPDGRVLDRIDVESLPTGFPCWYPGTRARVLFAGSDERLYHHAFEPAEGDGPGDAHPRLLRWRCDPPGGVEVRIADPCWPADDRFARIVLVGLRLPWPESGRPRFSTSRLWWLRLDPEGAAIVEAGPLLDPSPDPSALEIRSPAVGRAADGGLVLAYFTSEDCASWDLRISPLSFDDSGRPRRLSGPGPKLAGHCLPIIPPAFSTDGRRLSVVRSDGPGSLTVLRLDLAAPSDPPPPEPTPSDADSPPGKWSLVVSAVRALFDEARRTSPRGRTGEGL